MDQVSEAKILGVTIRCDLKWNSHIDNLLKKANKRLYMLVLCKRAGLKCSDMIAIYTSIIRSVMEYCSVVWHTSLPKYLSDSIEKVQKRALHIIYGVDDYEKCLLLAHLQKLSDRREEHCRRLCTKMHDPSHKLNDLLPNSRTVPYNLRDTLTMSVPLCHTDRYAKTFLPYCLKHF